MVSQSTAITGSTLVRLLARLTQVDAAQSPQVFTEQLGQWIGWAEAIPLSAALSAAGRPQSVEDGVWLPDAAHAQRVLDQLQREIDDEAKPPVRRTRMPTLRGVPLPPPVPDFGSWRRRYQTRQQAFDNAVAPLRAQLRQALAAQSAEGARLAAVDQVMERVLALQERQWLAGVPALLEQHYERLRQAAEATPEPANPQDPGDEPPWLRRFVQDLQHLLRAELEFRWQAIAALLAALSETRAHPNNKETQ
ncbi:DUF3348 family protein [Xenophilus arseniciresistens]|uniref:DUF3348 family protein n=1 Tax=Xenophilus arseniciresistens TaxID=1283306 RepID=A0AAE3SZK8_9BURK|nr:DUF3348 family protein [Xenophilus arseniciresistens]MDA7416630.1 DUF3348 family protein [Xenophilus arseniciresistens]